MDARRFDRCFDSWILANASDLDLKVVHVDLRENK